MAKTSPTQRALADMRAMGWECQVVERWNPHSMTRHDLFGCIDIVAMDPRENVLRELTPVHILGQLEHKPKFGAPILIGVQVTSAAGHSARRKKVLAEPRIRMWLECGARFEVWSYGKKGAAGKRKTWTLRRDEVTLSDFGKENA